VAQDKINESGIAATKIRQALNGFL